MGFDPSFPLSFIIGPAEAPASNWVFSALLRRGQSSKSASISYSVADGPKRSFGFNFFLWRLRCERRAGFERSLGR
jgi:hypothetical protein